MMNLELLKYINVDLKWNIAKKGRRTMTRRPRKLGTIIVESGVEIDNRIPAFETKKSSTDVLGLHFAEKVIDAPLKKRRLLHQSSSPPLQTPCLIGDGGLEPGPHTPSVHREDSGQRYHSNSLSQSNKTKSKTRFRNSNVLNQTKYKVPFLDDFSGIELLAAAACSSLIHDNTGHIEDSCAVDMKEAFISTEADCLLIQNDMVPNAQNVHDDGKKGVENKDAPLKGLRLHWDLNTVMDEWEEPCNESCSEGVDNGGLKSVNLNLEGNESIGVEERSMLTNQLSGKDDTAISTVPENCNGDLVGETCELIEDLTSNTSVLRESDSVDDLIVHSTPKSITIKSDQPPVSEEVMQGECKSYSDNKVNSEDPLSECCGSNVTQDEQVHTMDKVEVDYDSPFEDGELREPIGVEKEIVCYEPEIIYKDDFDVNPLSETIEASHERGQTMEDQTSLLGKNVMHYNDIEQGARVGTSERKNDHNESRPLGGNLLQTDESTSFDVCRNGAYERQTRSSNIGDYYSRSMSGPCVDSSTRAWDLKNSHDHHKPKHLTGDPFSSRASGCRSLDSNNHSRSHNPRGAYRKSSPPERHNGYRGPPSRSHSRDGFKGGSGFHPRRTSDEDPKPRFPVNFNRPTRRSRSRSRSGSPIAWHFQKRNNSGEMEGVSRGHVSPERSSKWFDERSQFRRRNQRFEAIVYKPKSEDHFRFSGRNHDGHYEKVNRVGRSDEGARRFRYALDDSLETRNGRNVDGRCFKEGESKS